MQLGGARPRVTSPGPLHWQLTLPYMYTKRDLMALSRPPSCESKMAICTGC